MIKLRCLGEDYWSRPVYVTVDQKKKKYYCDVGCGSYRQPSLYSYSGNDPDDGEPDMPLVEKYEIVGEEEE